MVSKGKRGPVKGEESVVHPGRGADRRGDKGSGQGKETGNDRSADTPAEGRPSKGRPQWPSEGVPQRPREGPGRALGRRERRPGRPPRRPSARDLRESTLSVTLLVVVPAVHYPFDRTCGEGWGLGQK